MIQHPAAILVTAGLLAAGLAVGIATAALLDAAVGPSFTAAVVALFPGGVGSALWLLAGASALTTFSWTIPLTAAMTAAVFVLADPWSLVVEGVCIAVLLVMVFLPRAGLEWTRAVGRLFGRR